MKVKVGTIILLLMCFMLMNIPYLSQRSNNIITLGLEILILFWLCTVRHSLSLFYNSFLVVLFMLLMVTSTFINFGISTRVLTAIVTGVEYILIFWIIDRLSNKWSIQEVINIIWKYVSIIMIIVDLCIILTGAKGIGGQQVLAYYLIGNKFTVSYFHMILLALFLAQNRILKKEKNRKCFFFLLLVYSIMICYSVDCNTGVIGCIAMGGVLLIFYYGKDLCKLLENPTFFVGVFIGSTFLIVGTKVLLENELVQLVVTKVFNRSLTLTGRLQMFDVTLQAISLKPALGYGINSTYVQDVLTWGNPQNGLLKMLLDFGIIGTAVFLMLCWCSLSGKSSKSQTRHIEISILAFLYGMVVCSMVEINISGLFFLGLALYRGCKQIAKKGVVR